MDPQQELFTALFLLLKDAGYSVYDSGLPSDGTPYPFIYLADSQLTDDANKGAVFGRVYQTIHVWHNDPGQRGTVSSLLLAIKTICRNLQHSINFAWSARNVTQRILSDNSTSSPLLHGVLDVEFYFS